MRYFPVIIVALISVHPIAAQTLDRAKLRAAVSLPEGIRDKTPSIDFRCLDRDDDGVRLSPKREIEQLTGRLRGDVNDAAILLEIAEWQWHHDRVQFRDTVRRVRSMLETRLQTKNPSENRIPLWYAELLALTEDDCVDEYEKLAIRSLELNPKDWQGWTHIGWAWKHKGIRALIGAKAYAELSRKSVEIVAEAAGNAKPTSEARAEAEKYLKSAAKCYEHACKLAPTDLQCHKSRLSFLIWDMCLRTTLAHGTGDKQVMLRADYSEYLAHAKQIARAFPNVLVPQINAAQLELTRLAAPVILKHGASSEDWPKFPAEQFRYLFAQMEHIERLADKLGPCEPSEFARKTLVIFGAFTESPAVVERQARILLDADAESDFAWDMLVLALQKQKRTAEADRLIVERYQKHRSEHASVDHARLMVRNGNEKEAEANLRDSQKRFPESATIVLSLIAVILRQRDDARSLNEVEELLERTQRLTLNPDYSNRLVDHAFYSAIYSTLAENAAIGRLTLRNILAERPNEERVKLALGAFSD